MNAPEQQPVPSALAPDPLAQSFVRFAMDCQVLRFGEFQTKAGRLSPYFFNAGLFDDGNKLMQLAQFYAQRILQEDCYYPDFAQYEIREFAPKMIAADIGKAIAE